jgi:hypothetical protein
MIETKGVEIPRDIGLKIPIRKNKRRVKTETEGSF